MAPRRRNARRASPGLRERVAGLGSLLAAWASRLLALVAVALLGAGALLSLDALRALPVERIVVGGKLEHLRQEALRDALATELGDGLLFLDLAALRARVEALPWVYRAELRRRFPDTLEVRVVEQVPIARWGVNAFLNHEARVIEVADAARWAELPQIRGPQGSEARLMAHYRRLREELAPLALTPVALVEDDFGQLAAELDGGMQLQLGDHDFSQRLQRFVRLWQAELSMAPGVVRRVDMRYEEGAAVAFDEPAQIAGLTDNNQDG